MYVCTCKIPAQKEKKNCCEYKETNFISISPTNNDICSSFVKAKISSFLLQLHLKNPCATFWVLGQAARLTLVTRHAEFLLIQKSSEMQKPRQEWSHWISKRRKLFTKKCRVQNGVEQFL
jgi:hypothetical protein